MPADLQALNDQLALIGASPSDVDPPAQPSPARASRRVTVADYAGMEPATAIAQIRAAGLVPAPEAAELTDVAPLGVVSHQEPAPGDTVTRGSVVALFIPQPRAPRDVAAEREPPDPIAELDDEFDDGWFEPPPPEPPPSAALCIYETGRRPVRTARLPAGAIQPSDQDASRETAGDVRPVSAPVHEADISADRHDRRRRKWLSRPLAAAAVAAMAAGVMAAAEGRPRDNPEGRTSPATGRRLADRETTPWPRRARRSPVKHVQRRRRAAHGVPAGVAREVRPGRTEAIPLASGAVSTVARPPTKRAVPAPVAPGAAELGP